VPTPHSPGGLVQLGQGSLPMYGEHPSPVWQYCVATWQVISPAFPAQLNVPVPHALCCEPPESCVVLPAPESGDVDDPPASVSPPLDPPPVVELLLHA
jgi:hypothetical protein